jgi:F-type H+-transporting ATPase subunit a
VGEEHDDLQGGLGLTPQPLWHLGPFAIRSTTMLLTWVSMAVVLIVFRLGARRLSVERPSGLQNVLEFIVEFVKGFISDTVDAERGGRLFNVLFAMLVFILGGNLLGLIPYLSSPTSDPNATFGLAIIVFLLIHFWGIRYKGVFGHLGSQFATTRSLGIVMMLLMGTLLILFEWFLSPVVLAMRLFGNIFAGDTLTGLAMSIAPTAFNGLGAVISLIASIVIHLGVDAFNTFVDLVQAYVFVILALVYVGSAMQTEGEH